MDEAQILPLSESSRLLPYRKIDLNENYDNYAASFHPLDRRDIQRVITHNWNSASLYENPSNATVMAVTWLGENTFRHEIPENEMKNIDEMRMEQTNQFLLDAYNKATELYPWEVQQKGLIISGDDDFRLAKGNIPYNILISYEQTVKPMMQALQEGNPHTIERMKNSLAAAFVHERTHAERSDGSEAWEFEVMSHAAQFIYDPKNNESFLRELKRVYNRIRSKRTEKGEEQLSYSQAKKNMYDKARYVALLLVADNLSEQNPKIKALLEQDTDPAKLSALEELPTILEEKDTAFLRQTTLPYLMSIPYVSIDEVYATVREKHHITEEITE